MPIVYVLQEPRPPLKEGGTVFTITSAEVYGEIKYIYVNGDPRPSYNVEWAINRAKEALAEVRPEDYLLFAGGDPLAFVIVSAIFADLVGGGMNYLCWQKGLKSYAPVWLSLYGEEE